MLITFSCQFLGKTGHLYFFCRRLLDFYFLVIRFNLDWDGALHRDFRRLLRGTYHPKLELIVSAGWWLLQLLCFQLRRKLLDAEGRVTQSANILLCLLSGVLDLEDGLSARHGVRRDALDLRRSAHTLDSCPDYLLDGLDWV